MNHRRFVARFLTTLSVPRRTGLVPDSIRADKASCDARETDYAGLYDPYTGDLSSEAFGRWLEDIGRLWPVSGFRLRVGATGLIPPLRCQPCPPPELAPGFAAMHPERALRWRMICRSNPPLPRDLDYGALMLAASVSEADARAVTVRAILGRSHWVRKRATVRHSLVVPFRLFLDLSGADRNGGRDGRHFVVGGGVAGGG